MSVAGNLHARLDQRRQRRRLTRGHQFREVNELLKQRREVSIIRRQPKPLIELPEPVRVGWERYFFVRPDVLKAPEGPTIEKLLALLQRVEYSNRKDFATRNWRRGNKLRPRVHRLQRISDKEFHNLSAKQQRYFAYYAVRHKRDGSSWVEHTYEFLHPWKYVSRTRPYFVTHRALPHSEADSREDFLDNKLFGPDYKYRHFARYKGDYYSDWEQLAFEGPSVEEELILERGYEEMCG